MSTSPSDPTPPAGSPWAPVPLTLRPAETAPSAMMAELPGFARFVGFAGLFLFVLGLVAVITNLALPTPRWIGIGGGYMFAALGLALMLYHALRDPEPEIRRMYGVVAAAWLVLAVAAAVVPGPLFAKNVVKEVGANMFPWSVAFGLLGLLFAIPFARHETDPTYREIIVYGLLGVGGLLTVGTVGYGIIKSDFLAGWGMALALLGLLFLSAFLSQVDDSEGLGYWVAFGLGALGAALIVYAVGRAVVPTVLFEGPGALRQVNQSLDMWKVAMRGLAVLVFLGIAAGAAVRGWPVWLRAALAAVGLAGAIVLVVGATTRTIYTEPGPFLIPGGLTLLGLGVVYLAVALGVCSENAFVTLVRRELAAYFLSGMGYVVLFGMAVVAGLAYLEFAREIQAATTPIREPILQNYLFAILIPIFAVLFLVPALTMRLFAEERRTGSLEVLLTAPVGEATIVLSKFTAAWIFFMLSWLPFGLYLIGLRVEGGQPFDYRPLLSFYLALAFTGAGFVGMGLFFSSLTRNQLVAAMLTFGGMLVLLLTFPPIVNQFPFLGASGKAFLSRLSFLWLWRQAMGGQLLVRDLFVHGSLAVFWGFLTVKVLEARKWS